MTDLADDIYEATGMILGTQQAAAMTAFIEQRERAARVAALEEAAQTAHAYPASQHGFMAGNQEQAARDAADGIAVAICALAKEAEG